MCSSDRVNILTVTVEGNGTINYGRVRVRRVLFECFVVKLKLMSTMTEQDEGDVVLSAV